MPGVWVCASSSSPPQYKLVLDADEHLVGLGL